MSVRYDVSFHRGGEPDVLRIPGIGDDIRAGCSANPPLADRERPRGPARPGHPQAPRPRRIVSDYSGPGPEHPAIDPAAWWFGYWQPLEYAQPVVERLADALELEDAEVRRSSSGFHVRRTDMLLTGDRRCRRRGSPERFARLEPDLPATASGSGRTTRSGVEPSSTSAGGSRSPSDGPPLRHLRGVALCRVLLISRSTFSWWAANLATGRGARVAYPAPWWPGTPALDRTLVPQSWMPIEVSARAAERPASI